MDWSSARSGGKTCKISQQIVHTYRSRVYSNNGRELLGVLFVCEKLHTYVFDHTINCDHKPLESIFKEPISLVPSHLHRVLLGFRVFDLNVKYVGTKIVLLADTHSRLGKLGSSQTIPDLNVHIAQVMSIKPTHPQSLQAETKEDPTLSQIIEYINDRWPSHTHHLMEAVQPYWFLMMVINY